MADLDFTFTGKLAQDCRSILIDFTPSFARLLYPHVDTPLEINIKKFHKKRSVAQNAWMWGVCIPTIRAWMKENDGECPSKEAIYAFLRTAVVGQEVIVETVHGIDVFVIKGKRFSEMTTVEFSEAVEKIILHYAEMDLEIKLPIPKTNNYITDYLKDMKDE